MGRSKGPGKDRKGTGWINKMWMEEEGDTEPEKEWRQQAHGWTWRNLETQPQFRHL